MFGLSASVCGIVNMWRIPGDGVTWLSFGIETGTGYLNTHFCIFGIQLFDITIAKK